MVMVEKLTRKLLDFLKTPILSNTLGKQQQAMFWLDDSVGSLPLSS